MESFSDSSPVITLRVSLSHLASILQPDDVVTYKYGKPLHIPAVGDRAPDRNHKDPPSPSTIAFLPTLDGLGLMQQAYRFWDHLCRFATYYYSHHVLAPRHAPWCREEAHALLPAAAQMAIFDDNSWLVTLPDHPWLGLPLAATGLDKIYSEYMDWRRRDAAGLVVVQQRGGKPLQRRVRLAPGDHVVSVFEGGSTGMTEDTLFVIMEMDCDGELIFYHDCLHCRDLTCDQCIEVLENVAAFGRRHTRASQDIRHGS